jgi:DNA-binding winged helix-turn-helix (wHTH) protein/TolB-like protein
MLLVSRTLDFDRFRFKLPARELLLVAEDGSEMPIPLGLRAADVLLFFLERPGELVTKSEIMQAVWPDVVVEESNLTVHISAIRRAIDDGRDGESCIQNLPRRGYRFTLDVTESGAAAEGQNHRCVTYPPENAPMRRASSPSLEALAAAPPLIASTGGGGRFIQNWWMYAAATAAVLLVAGTTVFVGRETPALVQPVQSPEPHLASIVALPFANASGSPKDEELAAALTEDVTISLDQISGAYVIARSMAQTLAARKLPLSRIGSELRVRYVLEGNVRRSPEGLELKVELSEAASGASIWTRQVKGSAGEPSDLRSQAAGTLLFPLRTAFMDAEAGRLARRRRYTGEAETR